MNTGPITKAIKKEALKKGLSVKRVNVDGDITTYSFHKDSSEFPELYSVDIHLKLEAFDKEHLPRLIEEADKEIDKSEKEIKAKLRSMTKQGYTIRVEAS